MTIRVNIRTVANMGAIRRERRNGRDKIIVPSVTLPDDVIMNNIKYPADEIAKGFATLNGTLAPLGHPTIEGQFVSASHPEGINIGWIGAYNENVRRENGRVFLDKVIDVQRAKESDGGKAVLAAIEKGEPIHTSTGLLCNLEEAEGEGYTHIARDMEFDHDAILLGEQGAATPEQGVGMMVNAKGEAEEITVINSSLDDQLDQEIEWAVDSIARAIERKEEREENRPLLERIKSAILEALGAEERETPATNRKDADMADNKQLDELSQRVNALSENAVTKEDLTNALTEAMKPLVDAQAEMKANQEAKDKADHEALVNKVVEAKIEGLGKDVAERMDATALNAVLAMHTAQNKKAAPLASGFAINTGEEDSFSPLGWGAKQ